jgi:hypothetical protein
VAKVPLPPTPPQVPGAQPEVIYPDITNKYIYTPGDGYKLADPQKKPEFANPEFAYIDDPTDFVTMPDDGLIAPGAGSINTQAFVDWVNDKTGEKRSVSSGGYTAAPGSGWRQAAKGGSMAVKRPSKSFAVRGAGDGRSDDIPAVLSDGEYVMDAETVALLGNGSNKAGAAQLDRFRANVRKHKGKDLAKGRFSVNAKNPQAYMAGGRT